MLDHLGMAASNLVRSKHFYSACLAPLGITLLEDHSGGNGPAWLVYGTEDDAPFFVVSGSAPSFWNPSNKPGVSPIHIAFEAHDRASVDEFYRQGIAHGGRDNGPPGERQSTTLYYAAYLLDPDGDNVEAGLRG
nr:putative integron gene cassette protein [uncultured bacterium]